MSSGEVERRTRHILDLGNAVLRLVADAKGLQVRPEALEALDKNLTDFIGGPYYRIFEAFEPQAPRNFMQGIETVSGSACSLALTAGRTYLSGSDINEAVKRHICSVWPFCR